VKPHCPAFYLGISLSKPWANRTIVVAIARVALCFSADAAASDQPAPASGSELDRALAIVLRQAGFTVRIEVTLERRIGHCLNPQPADAGRLLWFDTLTGLNNDNTCSAGTRFSRRMRCS
jgi:cytochrome c peroxidase